MNYMSHYAYMLLPTFVGYRISKTKTKIHCHERSFRIT